MLADVELTAQNRLDSLGLGRVKEVHRAVDVPVVGHGDRGLPQLRDAVNELLDVASPIQQGVLGVQMQMRKFSHGNFNSSDWVLNAICNLWK